MYILQIVRSFCARATPPHRLSSARHCSKPVSPPRLRTNFKFRVPYAVPEPKPSPTCVFIFNLAFFTQFPSQTPLQTAYLFPISRFIRSFQAKTPSKLRIYYDFQLFYTQIIRFQPKSRVNTPNLRIFTHPIPYTNRFLHRLQKSSFVQTFFTLFASNCCTNPIFSISCRKNHAFSHPDSARIRLFKFYAEKIVPLTARFLQKSHFPVFLQKKT